MAKEKILLLLPSRFEDSSSYVPFLRYLQKANAEAKKEGRTLSLISYEEEDIRFLKEADQKRSNNPLYFRYYFVFGSYPFSSPRFSSLSKDVLSKISERLKGFVFFSDPSLLNKLKVCVLSEDISMEGSESGLEYIQISRFFHYTRSVEDYFSLAENYGQETVKKVLTGDRYRLFASMMDFWGDTQKAESYLSRERKIREELDPSDYSAPSPFRLDRMLCYLKLSSLYCRQGMLSHARDYIHQIHIDEPRFQGEADYLIAQIERKDTTHKARHRREAKKHLEKAVSAFYPFLDEDLSFYAMRIHFCLYQYLLLCKRRSEIGKVIHRDFRFIAEIEKKDSYLASIITAYAYLNAGMEWDYKKRYKKAYQDYQSSLTCFEKILPQDGSFANVYADFCLKLANCAEKIHLPEEANRISLKGIAVKEKLAQKEPVRYQNSLGVSYLSLAEFETKIQNYNLAISHYQKAISLYLPLYQEKKAGANKNLFACYRGLAYVYEACGRRKEAEKMVNLADKVVL